MAAVTPSDVRSARGDQANHLLLTVTLTSASDTVTIPGAPKVRSVSYIKTTGAGTALTFAYAEATGVLTIAAGAASDVVLLDLLVGM